MKKKTIYECFYCGKIFLSKEDCYNHEQQHKNINQANKMLKNGATLEEINQKYFLWNNLPKYLNDITKNNYFTNDYYDAKSHCLRKYNISNIDYDKKLVLVSSDEKNKKHYTHICDINDEIFKLNKANKMFKNGATLEEINQKYFLWNNLPAYLKTATKNSCFKLSKQKYESVFKISEIQSNYRLFAYEYNPTYCWYIGNYYSIKNELSKYKCEYLGENCSSVNKLDFSSQYTKIKKKNIRNIKPNKKTINCIRLDIEEFSEIIKKISPKTTIINDDDECDLYLDSTNNVLKDKEILQKLITYFDIKEIKNIYADICLEQTILIDYENLLSNTNIEDEQLIKCFCMNFEEFNEILYEIFSEDITIDSDDGSILYLDENDDVIDEEEIFEELAKYLNVKMIDNIYEDNSINSNIFISYKN